MEEAPSDESRPSPATSRGTLIPSGFESVAHPVFFRTIDLPPDAGPPSRRRRHQPSPTSTTTTTTINPTSTAARNIDALDSEGDLGANAGAADGGSGNSSRSSDERSLREVPSVCPICLEKFEQPVTLTSCLHTFCHTCILGWYEHTVAVALSRGDLSAFSPESGLHHPNRSSGNRGPITALNTTTATTSRSKPYRCPLCQVPGPFFLAVERPRYKTNKTPPGSKPPKLKFKLLGARTVFGGGGEKSGGVAVDEHSGSGGGDRFRGDVGNVAGYPSPGMTDLRAAARTQHALASAVAREARATSGEGSRTSSAGKRGDGTAGRGKGGVRDNGGVVADDRDQGESARLPGRGGNSSSSSGGSGSRAGSGDRDAAGDIAVEGRGGGGGGVVGAGDEGRAASVESRLEDGRHPLPLDRGEGGSPSRRHQDRDRFGPRPGSRDNGEGDRRTKGRKRRRSEEERGDDGLDFREVLSAVGGGGAPDDSRGMSSGVLPNRNRSNPCSSNNSTGRSGEGIRVDLYSDGTERGKKRSKKRRRTERRAMRKGERASVSRNSSSSSSSSSRSRRNYSIDRDDRDGPGTGADPGGARCSGGAARSGGGLLWEPGSMPAEDGLEAIEALLAKEKESLRRKAVGKAAAGLRYDATIGGQ